MTHSPDLPAGEIDEAAGATSEAPAGVSAEAIVPSVKSPVAAAVVARKRPRPGERRVQILETLATMLQEPGAERITTAALAAKLDVSEAALYRHFASKSDLYAEAMDCFFTNPECGNRWEGVEVDPAKGPVGPQIVRAYLSRQHFQDIEDSCPMVALPGDVARSGANA